jgi:hypothetical protein
VYKFWVNLRYRWAMVNAYLSQDYAPVASAQWLNEADQWQMELWRIERGLV